MNKLQFIFPILIVICLGSFAQQQVNNISDTIIPGTGQEAPTTTTTTVTPTPAPTNATTTTTVKPPAPSTNSTTTTTTTQTPTTTTTIPTTLAPNATTIPTTPTPSTNATTTAVPATNGTTTTAVPPTTPKPAPASGFAWGSFFSGIIFTAGIGSVAYVVWRFYKVRTERNYHTL